MEYITSRRGLFADQEQMENYDWFNMWEKRNLPYRDLLKGDVIYWFDSKAQKISWKTEVLSVNRFYYSNKQNILERYPNNMGLNYYGSRPEEGYFIGYKVKILEKLNLDKPIGFNFPRLGWLSVDNEIALKWFRRQQIDDTNTLDENVSEENKSITEQLVDLNKKMQSVSPERIEKLVLTTIRKDTKIINALKIAADYRCQFPNCGHQIMKKNGSFYVEVAHIKPVSSNGQSVLGNLFVLCPNHHKEFDLGNLKISEQKPTKLIGQLNGRDFEIELTNHE